MMEAIVLIAAGAGTVALEILEEVPDLDVLIIPLGDGALAGGCGVVVKALAPHTRTLGVQAEACPAMFRSWQRGEVVRVEGQTLADGLAVVEPHPGAVKILRRVLDDVVLVSERELEDAIRLLLRYTHNLAEGAGAAALAGGLKARETLAGRKVAAHPERRQPGHALAAVRAPRRRRSRTSAGMRKGDAHVTAGRRGPRT